MRFVQHSRILLVTVAVSACDSGVLDSFRPDEKLQNVEMRTEISSDKSSSAVASVPDTPVSAVDYGPLLNLDQWQLSDGVKMTSLPNVGDEALSITFPTESKGFAWVRVPTFPGVSYHWKANIRSAGEEPQTLALGFHDGEFERKQIEVGTEWEEFSMTVTSNANYANFYLDGRVRDGQLFGIEVSSLSIEPAQ